MSFFRVFRCTIYPLNTRGHQFTVDIADFPGTPYTEMTFDLLFAKCCHASRSGYAFPINTDADPVSGQPNQCGSGSQHCFKYSTVGTSVPDQ
jgi:hypothetical protein